jgi:hypothetical protein
MPEPSSVLLYGFLGLLALTIPAALKGVKTSASDSESISSGKVAGGLALWMAVTAGAALAGITANFDTLPPPLMVIVLIGFIITIVLAGGRLGSQIAMGVPIASLIAFQSFRFPLELLLHRAYTDGLMPVQMSFEGRNFDIFTGVAGLFIGLYFMASKKEVPRGLAWTFNLAGLALLFNIVGVAIASMPVFAFFGNNHINTWVGYFPFVWLPAIFVTFALFGHLALTRKLLMPPSS